LFLPSVVFILVRIVDANPLLARLALFANATCPETSFLVTGGAGGFGGGGGGGSLKLGFDPMLSPNNVF
tara:strand:+ start:89 stop:295 length:207 start_codon:yes stop_codon:yes gene_type:complete